MSKRYKVTSKRSYSFVARIKVVAEQPRSLFWMIFSVISAGIMVNAVRDGYIGGLINDYSFKGFGTIITSIVIFFWTFIEICIKCDELRITVFNSYEPIRLITHLETIFGIPFVAWPDCFDPIGRAQDYLKGLAKKVQRAEEADDQVPWDPPTAPFERAMFKTNLGMIAKILPIKENEGFYFGNTKQVKELPLGDKVNP